MVLNITQEEDGEGVSMVQALNRALYDAMQEDERVVVLGEDVGVNGGVFRVTEGLFEQFGDERVVDTPLAEATIAGVSVGMAAMGLRPVVEIQFMGFSPPIIDQLVCHASRFRNRTRGGRHCPLVIRMPYGAGVHAPEHHSESIEALFAHIPGVRVVVPSSPKKAYGLLLAAIRDPDPVVFLEPKRIYRMKEQTVFSRESLPLDTSFVLCEGSDVTLVSWGASLKETLVAADVLRERGESAEVIDVATLGATFDMGQIVKSVEKTGRCLIVHEAVLTGGFGAEIAARLADEAIYFLESPIKRVTGYDTIVPYSRLEHRFLPDAERILQAASDIIG